MTFTVPKIIPSYLSNGAYGYPQGAKRRHKPTVLCVVHITGNRRTAAVNGTRGEVAYMNRPLVSGGHYNSAHSYIDRNGVVYACVPLDFPAWNNGDLLKPNLKNVGVKSLVQGAKQGINANELCQREVECTGYPGSYPVTDAQIESVSFLVARDSIKTGLPINRNTVLTHADLNSVNRVNCAFPPKTRELSLGKIIVRANAIKAEMKNTDPDPPEPPIPPVDPCQSLQEQLDAATDANDDLQDQVDELNVTNTAWVAYADAIAAIPRPDAA